MLKKIILTIAFVLLLPGVGWGMDRLCLIYGGYFKPNAIFENGQMIIKDFYFSETPEEVANLYDMIIVGSNANDIIPMLKSHNPEIKAFVYHHMLGIYPNTEGLDRFPDSWFVRDKTTCRRAQHVHGWYVADITNPECRNWIVSDMARKVTEAEADGVFIDGAFGGVGLRNERFKQEGLDQTADISKFSNQFPAAGELLLTELASPLGKPSIAINPDGAFYDSYAGSVMIEAFLHSPSWEASYQGGWDRSLGQIERLKEIIKIGAIPLLYSGSKSGEGMESHFWYAYLISHIFAPNGAFGFEVK